MDVIRAETTTPLGQPLFIQSEGATIHRIVGSEKEARTESLTLTGKTEIRISGEFELREKDGKLEAFAQIGIAKDNPDLYWVALRVLRTTR